MKSFTLKFVAITLAAAFSSTAFAAESIKASVNGMVCAFCAQGIEKRLSSMPATKAVLVDLKKKVVAVEAKEGQTLDREAIRHEIKEAGYDVTKLETVPQSVAEIRAQMKAAK
ncbi:MAG: heavy-metal-associated domain-containing protein [Polaromonas sp.]|uniref:heavy-metal-associated domain-containing protein n=1 Tax=Polaromonas sp. TaxID=1869339 RepID=UPI0018066299|nr:heavy metal-associated domain-containing protein [Polaromonas sp.]MBA3592223.1 heavy-metal-associated domain-containing protein [Polaromonas sp.]